VRGLLRRLLAARGGNLEASADRDGRQPVEKAPQSARRSEKVARRVAVRGMVATFRTPAAKTQRGLVFI